MKKTNTNFKYTPKPNEDSDSSEGDDIKLPDDKKIILPVFLHLSAVRNPRLPAHLQRR